MRRGRGGGGWGSRECSQFEVERKVARESDLPQRSLIPPRRLFVASGASLPPSPSGILVGARPELNIQMRAMAAGEKKGFLRSFVQ